MATNNNSKSTAINNQQSTSNAKTEIKTIDVARAAAVDVEVDVFRGAVMNSQ